MKKQILNLILKYILVLVLIALLAEFVFFQGAHPECASNDSVGPCEFVPRVSQYVGYAGFFFSPLFLVHLVIAVFFQARRNDEKPEAKHISGKKL